MNFRLAGIVAVVLVLMICACGCSQLLPAAPRPTPSITRQPVEPTPFPTFPQRAGPPGMTWYLLSLQNGTGTVPVIPNSTISAFFDGQGTVSGTAGCNDYTASYTNATGTFAIGPPTSTERYCGSPAGVMDQEAAYLRLLQEARSYSVDGQLRLADGAGRVILTYTLTPLGTPVPAPLVNTSWHATSFVNESGQTYSPRGLTPVTLIFGADGTLYGNAGCNNYVGTYRQTGEDAISIGDLRTTRLYCGIAGVMEIEATYLALLPRMTRYAIAGDTLTLSDADGRLTIAYDTKSAE